jgi:hypothetical protein
MFGHSRVLAYFTSSSDFGLWCLTPLVTIFHSDKGYSSIYLFILTLEVDTGDRTYVSC